MFESYLVNKSYEPLSLELEPIPYETESEALSGSGRLLQEMGCNIIWMKNVDTSLTKNVTPSDKVVAVYSGDKDICILISNLSLTGEKGNPTPLEEEMGPYYLRR